MTTIEVVLAAVLSPIVYLLIGFVAAAIDVAVTGHRKAEEGWAVAWVLGWPAIGLIWLVGTFIYIMVSKVFGQGIIYFAHKLNPNVKGWSHSSAEVFHPEQTSLSTDHFISYVGELPQAEWPVEVTNNSD